MTECAQTTGIVYAVRDSTVLNVRGTQDPTGCHKIGVYVDDQFDRDAGEIAKSRGVKVNQHLSEIVRDAVRLLALKTREMNRAKEDRDGQ